MARKQENIFAKVWSKLIPETLTNYIAPLALPTKTNSKRWSKMLVQQNLCFLLFYLINMLWPFEIFCECLAEMMKLLLLFTTGKKANTVRNKTQRKQSNLILICPLLSLCLFFHASSTFRSFWNPEIKQFKKATENVKSGMKTRWLAFVCGLVAWIKLASTGNWHVATCDPQTIQLLSCNLQQIKVMIKNGGKRSKKLKINKI